jgi:hypothetical protein
MKLTLIAAAALLASCKGKPREAPAPGPGSGAPASAAGAGVAAEPPAPDLCRSSTAAVDQATCKTPEARQQLLDAKQAIDRIAEASFKVGGADHRQLQVMCAQVLLAIEQDAAKLSCTVAIDARQRKEITALLDAWYAQRTPVAPTGDAASDAVIARIAAVRDAACACRDAACLDRVDQQLVSIGAMPQAAPASARTLGSKLLEDAGRCASRVRTLGAPR